MLVDKDKSVPGAAIAIQPGRGEQMVRYYGYYSNVLRGKRKKAEKDEIIPCLIEETGVLPEKRKAWARLIQKIYKVDPLTCPHCRGTMTCYDFGIDTQV